MIIARTESTDRPRARGIVPARLAAAAVMSIALNIGATSVAAARSDPPNPSIPPVSRTPEQAREKPVNASASHPYYKRSQLDARPYLVTRVEPDYPTGVPPTGGKARVRLFINERGFVDRVAIVESTPPAKFGEAAADAFKSAQFEPGKRRGVAVKSQILIEMEFAPLLPKGAK